ncbi:MAG: choline-sulfatase [Actinomycetia bacterium]|nr:choline-sulfatase [Actinomycetes bacterium]
MTRQPNILLIQVDQLAASFLPAYGNTIAKTPHLDVLSERSVVFDSAYTNFSLCAPSRFSMMSGRLASEIGAYDNGAEFPSSIPTFAHYLCAAGYHTSLVGKMHFVGADQLHGFDERLTTDIYPSSFAWTGDWTQVREEHSNDSRTFERSGPYLRTAQMDYDDEVVHRARRKLYDLARGDGIDADQPWLLTASFTHPHDPYQCRPEHWDLYAPDEIDLPVVARIPDAQADPHSLRLLFQYGLADIEPTEEQVRRVRHGYYGSISYVDDLVGELFSTLTETGLADHTVVVFTTDHGDMMGERGLWYKKSFFEGASRIPLMVSWPERFDAKRVGDNVSLVDLLPTFCDLAGRADLVGSVDPLDGRSLVTLMETGADNRLDDIIYAENLAEGATAPILMVKRGPLKMIVSGCDPEQLFDLDLDPNELNNVVKDAAYVDVAAELRALVHTRWNIEALNERVRESQARRHFLRAVAHRSGTPDWSHVPPDQPSSYVLRDDETYNDWAYGHNLESGAGS